MNQEIECLTDEHCKYILGLIGSSTGSIADDGEILHLLVQDLQLNPCDDKNGYSRLQEVIKAISHDAQ